MICSIGDDYYLADGTLAGGYSLTGLRLRMQRIFDVVQPLQEFLDPTNLTDGNTYTLDIGMVYRIAIYVPGDDFTNIGGTNATGAIFIATGSTPLVWLESIVVALSPKLFDRNKRRVDITFTVQRVQESINAAEDFCLIHEATVPRTGDIKFIVSDTGDSGETIVSLIVDGVLLSLELVRQIGAFTEYAYHIQGSPLFTPTPGDDLIATEDGFFILTETGDRILIE
jgi:hypothetical protein